MTVKIVFIRRCCKLVVRVVQRRSDIADAVLILFNIKPCAKRRRIGLRVQRGEFCVEVALFNRRVNDTVAVALFRRGRNIPTRLAKQIGGSEIAREIKHETGRVTHVAYVKALRLFVAV